MAAAGPRTYADFVPPHKLVEKADKKVLQIDLSGKGFKKEQLRVQIDNHGRLRISGERQVSGNQWSRFYKEFQVPEDCNAGDVRARFESKDRVLHVIMPKLSPEEPPKPTPAPAAAPGAKTRAGAGSNGQGATAPAGPGHGAAAAAAQQTAAAPTEEQDEEEREEYKHTGHDDGGDDGGREDASDEPAATTVSGASLRRKTPWPVLLAVVLALLAAAGFYAKYRLMDPSADQPAPADGGVQLFGFSDQ
ncbi:protein kintoun-like [Oryza brachyantha]|uniref:protein kintoun-like n=1 Tax=Oryza brachyantha TaxID=4533 RepID=UPI001AD97AF2|nr:protein kintoun-like [Oryza brachyantha]